MRRPWLALLLGALVWTGVASELAWAALSPEAFTQEYATTLRAALPAYQVEILEPLQLRVTDAKGDSSTAYLDNAYRQYQADPEARQEIIEQHVKGIAEMAIDTPLVPANIVPVIKDLAWLAETNLAIRKSGGTVGERVHEPLNDLLLVVYAEDTPTNIRYFSPEMLDKAGVDRRKLPALARENLRRLLPKVEIHAGELFTMLSAGGSYEASLLLLEDLWTGDQVKVDGEIVVAVPTRDVLLFTGSRNKEGVARLREVASDLFDEGSYTLTKELFVYRKGRFVRFEP